jgi:hypothetical protein
MRKTKPQDANAARVKTSHQARPVATRYGLSQSTGIYRGLKQGNRTVPAKRGSHGRQYPSLGRRKIAAFTKLSLLPPLAPVRDHTSEIVVLVDQDVSVRQNKRLGLVGGIGQGNQGYSGLIGRSRPLT